MTRRGRRAPVATPGALVVLWRFSRPHTIIGTALSVVGLYVIAAAEPDAAPGVGDLLATLVAALTVNIAIVGVNQITDVEIDRINKPWLPIAAGDLSLGAARVIVARLHARSRSRWRSRRAPSRPSRSPPASRSARSTRCRRSGSSASRSPRRCASPASAALVVNLGVYWHFAGEIAPPVWALCLFVLPFSFAIAVLKDVPDIEGDRRFAIRTFTVRLGPERVFHIGLAALAIAYGGMIVLGPWLLADYANPFVLVGGHLAAAALLWYWARQADPRDHDRLHALLHARLGALLSGVLAGADACLPLTLLDVRSRTNPHRWPERRGQASTGAGRFVGNVDCL